MFDIKNLRKEVGHYTAKIGASSVTFYFTKPNAYELMDFRQDAKNMFQIIEGLQQVEEETSIEVTSKDYQPLITHCAAFITRAEGIVSGGEPVEWASLDNDTRHLVLRELEPAGLWELLAMINSGTSLGEDQKNG